MSDCDILIIGAGHNALVCAGYLAKAGHKVLLLERRHKAGGAVVTEEHVPGFRFDLGGSAHILINHTPIVADLELERYGLDYIDVDPILFAPFPDGSHLFIHRDIDATAESIAQFSPQDADNYRQFIEDWMPLAQATAKAFLNAPTPVTLVRDLGFGSRFGNKWMERLSSIIRGYGQVLEESFVDPRVPAVIGWMAAQSGPPPTEPLSAPFALWHPMYHVGGLRRPRGGSGMLTQALQKMIEAHGGQVITDAPVKQILTAGGRAVGAETQDGQRFLATKAVVSGAHIQTTAKMLDGALPQPKRDAIDKTRIGNGFGMVVRYAMNELPNYTALPSPEDGTPGPQHRAMQMICPSLDYLNAAYGDFLRGKTSEEPALVNMTFSAVDPTLAPEGKHTMFTWAQYTPYKLADGSDWDDLAEATSERFLDKLAEYAPNVKGAVIDKLVETPKYIEQTLGLLQGNVMHLEMSFDQMFSFRPALNMNNYKLIPGLYLTGASTHPGGGIMGAAGYNAAKVILRDLEPKFFGLFG